MRQLQSVYSPQNFFQPDTTKDRLFIPRKIENDASIFLKIDANGTECKIFRGAQTLLNLTSIVGVLLRWTKEARERRCCTELLYSAFLQLEYYHGLQPFQVLKPSVERRVYQRVYGRYLPSWAMRNFTLRAIRNPCKYRGRYIMWVRCLYVTQPEDGSEGFCVL